MNARTSALTAALVSSIVPPATAAPMVPPKTRSIAGRISREAGLPPSSTFAAMMIAEAAADSDQGCLVHQRVLGSSGTDGEPAAARSVEASLRSKALAVAMIRARKSRTAVDDVVERLGHEVLRAVDEGDDRVGGAVDALHQIRVEGERGPRETGERDHLCTILVRSSAGPSLACTVSSAGRVRT